MIDFEIDRDGLAHIIWNNPHGAVNVKTDEAMAAFSVMVDKVIADPAIRGALIRSAKKDFVAGGDLMELYAIKTAAQAMTKLRPVGECLRRMERGGKPFVAVINGSALGGGLEIALACHHRIVSDDARIKLGLPEVTLGLIPGAGGTQRLPRLIGIAQATQLLMGGKSVSPKQALQIGLVDEMVPAERLLEASRTWLLSQPGVEQPWDRKGFKYPDFEPQSFEGRAHFFNAWPQLRRKSPVEDLAPGALLHVLGQGLERGIDAGLQIEARYFGQVAASASAKNRIRTQFIAQNAARKQVGQFQRNAPTALHKVGVVGAGTMGAGIALVSARAGLRTVLLDRDESYALAGKERIAKVLGGAVERHLMSTAERDQILDRITAGADFALLQGCEVVVEAIVEVAETKNEVFRKIFEAAGPDILLASNTSTLSITRMAAGVAHPGQFIGLHFFAPVDRMPLVEVIRGQQTTEQSLVRSLGFLKTLGKTPVVVNDGPGFYTSRVVASYTREALIMLGEGIAPALIDNAATAAGFPIGPLAMADLTSYDLLANILGSLARESRGTAVQSQLALDAVEQLIRAGRLGRKAAGGVYDHGANGKVVWAGLSKVFKPRSSQPSVQEVMARLMHIQSLETVHAINDGVASEPLALDLASVLGWSYPGFRGGPLAHVDDVGLTEFVGQCDAFAAALGPRFGVPDSLRQRASEGRCFHDHG
jgi:3-hydroxyacyl-CoA dehydrogenase/enoyl-CoA hydratase/3-hydroxybutyryl-CoA epimerase